MAEPSAFTPLAWTPELVARFWDFESSRHRALPVVAAADAATRNSFRPALAPFLAAAGLAEGDAVKLAAREAFDFACDGAARVKLKRVLDDFAWIAARGARPERDWRARVALRGLLAKAAGA